jgi:predicted membrane channel-forming protein YqfA (hemolysin III family)
MESFEILYLAYYGGFVASLFGILLFYGLRRKKVLNSRTAMLPLGMFLMGLGIILMGLEIIASMKYSFIIGITVSLIGGILFFIGSILYLWHIWKTNPHLKK